MIDNTMKCVPHSVPIYGSETDSVVQGLLNGLDRLDPVVWRTTNGQNRSDSVAEGINKEAEFQSQNGPVRLESVVRKE